MPKISLNLLRKQPPPSPRPTRDEPPEIHDLFIDNPWCIKIEFTKGCNLKCNFCPVSGDTTLQKSETWEYMTPEVIHRFATSYEAMRAKHSPRSWPRIEIALRGEPLLNPHAETCLSILRECLSECQITMFSNGLRLLADREMLNRLFDAGLNVLYLDCYNNTYDRFWKLCKEIKGPDVEQFDAHDFSPYRKHPRGYKRKVVSLLPGLDDREAHDFSYRPLHNVGGNADPDKLLALGWTPPKEEMPLKKNCSRVYRELTFHLTGDVVTCCVDWYPDEVTTLGNVLDQTVEEIWYGEKHLTALRRLWDKDRDWGLCRTCDYHGGYRLGFLKDPFISREEEGGKSKGGRGKKREIEPVEPVDEDETPLPPMSKLFS